MRSLSEIETISKRASRAAGFSWGIAEDVGKNIRLLELLKLPGIKNLNQYLTERNEKNFEKSGIITKQNNPLKSHFCPIILGINFIDQIRNLEILKSINFRNIAYPILLIPFLSRGSEIIGKKILFEYDNHKLLLNFNVNILSSFIDDQVPKKADNANIYFLENIDNFTENDWVSLYKLSTQTFVEESESLKQNAAGAGLNDND